MKKTDKILIGIVSGIILLVVVAFAVALLRPRQTYLSENTPEGVAFNYMFALQQGDYERAYSYLSPDIVGYPRNAEVFASNLRTSAWRLRQLDDASTTIVVEQTDIRGPDATVTLKETRFNENGLFDSNQYSRLFDTTLRQRPDKTWKIVYAQDYWSWCWNREGGCK